MATVERQPRRIHRQQHRRAARSPAAPQHRSRAGRHRQPAPAARSLRRSRPRRPRRRLLRRRPSHDLHAHAGPPRRRPADRSDAAQPAAERRRPVRVGRRRRLPARACQEVATAAHAEYYARIVRDKAVLRSLIHASTDIIQEVVRNRRRCPRNAGPRRRARLSHSRYQRRHAGPIDPRRAPSSRSPASTPACSTRHASAAWKPASSISTSSPAACTTRSW